MGFIIKKSYSRDNKEITEFYARIQQYTVERFPGTAYAMVQYFIDKEAAEGYTMKYARNTFQHEMEPLKHENFPIDISEDCIIGGEPFKMPDPIHDDFRISCFGFWFPLGEPAKVTEEQYEMQDSTVEMPYVDFDEDGNPVQATKTIPCKNRVLVKSEIVDRHITNHMLPEFMENPYAFLYKRLKPELEKIFGEGSVVDDL
jgi:hypothetical protein